MPCLAVEVVYVARVVLVECTCVSFTFHRRSSAVLISCLFREGGGILVPLSFFVFFLKLLVVVHFFTHSRITVEITVDV